jgi:hypothetical protein
VPPTVTSAAKNGDTVDFLAQLFNTGNAADNQTFTYATSGDWTPTTVQMWWDKDNSHTYTTGDELLAETSPGSKTYKTVNGAGTPVGAPVDDDYDVILRLTVPSGSPSPRSPTSTAPRRPPVPTRRRCRQRSSRR